MIRDATEADIPRILEMARRFFETTVYAGFSEFSETATGALVRHLIAAEDGILLVVEKDGVVGMAAAMAYPVFMTGQVTAQEIAWWIESEHRGAGLPLLKALEREAAARGARTLQMVALHDGEHERVGALYRRAGYRPTEHFWLKEI